MKRSLHKKAERETGQYELNSASGEEVRAFIPHPLPPSEPPLVLDGDLDNLLAVAHENLRLLDLAGDLVPSVEWFVYAFVRKEAVLSAQIEGTQATLMDLLEVEALGDATRDADVEEICGYIEALNYAWDELGSDGGLPISTRLLREAHRRILHGSRGEEKQPGSVRSSQNWIGGTRPGNAQFVPPPPQHLLSLLTDFEQFIHGDSSLPPLIKIGLLHAQFETIHPFLDGNGRLGRLLVTLLLRHWGLLSRPLLYLSLFLKSHREEYYRRLDETRTVGDWESWLEFFLEGVSAVAEEAVETSRRLNAIVQDCTDRLLARTDTTVLSVRLLKLLPEHPVMTITRAVELLDCSRPAAAKAIKILESAEILRTSSERKRNRELAFDAYLTELRQGTELR